MKPIVKNILIGGAIAIALASLYVYDKIDTALTVFDKIKIKPASFPKNIEFSNYNTLGVPQTIAFNIDIKIENPNNQEFSVSGYGVATLKQVDIYFKDFHVGTANLQLDEINVPTQSSVIIPNVAFTGGTLSVLQNLNAFTNANFSDLRFTGVIEAIGNTYEIG